MHSVGPLNASVPSTARDISSRCGMLGALVGVCVIPGIPQSALSLQTVPQVRQGNFFCTRFEESFLLRLVWRKALLQVLQAKAGGQPVLGFRSRLHRVMHNSWPPVNIPAEAPQHHGKSQWGFVY